MFKYVRFTMIDYRNGDGKIETIVNRTESNNKQALIIGARREDYPCTVCDMAGNILYENKAQKKLNKEMNR